MGHLPPGLTPAARLRAALWAPWGSWLTEKLGDADGEEPVHQMWTGIPAMALLTSQRPPFLHM